MDYHYNDSIKYLKEYVAIWADEVKRLPDLIDYKVNNRIHEVRLNRLVKEMETVGEMLVTKKQKQREEDFNRQFSN